MFIIADAIECWMRSLGRFRRYVFWGSFCLVLLAEQSGGLLAMQTKFEACVSHLMAVRRYHKLPRRSQDETQLALDSLRRMTNQYLSNDRSTPSSEAASASHRSLKWAKRRAAARLAGILKEYDREGAGESGLAEEGALKADPNQILFAVTFKGLDQIRDFERDLAEEARDLEKLGRPFMKYVFFPVLQPLIGFFFTAVQVFLATAVEMPALLRLLVFWYAWQNQVGFTETMVRNPQYVFWTNQLRAETILLRAEKLKKGQWYHWSKDVLLDHRDLSEIWGHGVPHEGHILHDTRHWLDRRSTRAFLKKAPFTTMPSEIEEEPEQRKRSFFRLDRSLFYNQATGQIELVIVVRLTPNPPVYPAPKHLPNFARSQVQDILQPVGTLGGP